MSNFPIVSLAAIACLWVAFESVKCASTMTKGTAHAVRFFVVSAGGLAVWSLSKTVDYAAHPTPGELSAVLLSAVSSLFFFFCHRWRH